jgi:hypothetical protein
MASSGEQDDVCCNENTTCLDYTVTKGASINGKYYFSENINMDKMVLLNLQDDIKELSSLLHTVTRSSGKEVMQHKIDTTLVKMASIIEDSTKIKDQNEGWTEVKNGKSKIIRKQGDQYAIPVFNNRYVLLENNEEGGENTSLDRKYKPSFGKVVRGKKKCEINRSRVLILGDSHARSMANELQHRLGSSFDVLCIVKPGSNMKEITKTLNLTASSLSKKDVCIIWGGSCDIAKNEREYGLRQVKDLVKRLNSTNLVVINAPYRHDLQGNSCVNSAVKKFNRMLLKTSSLLKWKTVRNCIQIMGCI